MEWAKDVQSIIEYFDLADGEYFCIQQRDLDNEEPTDSLLMNREVALQLAKDILEMLE